MDFALLTQRQRAFFRSGATLTPEFRSGALQKLLNALASCEAELLTALHEDLHKSAHDATFSEIGFVDSEIRRALRHLSDWMKPRRRNVPLLAWPGRGHVRPEPFGLTLIIGPWNYPLQLLLLPLVGAIAAGNCAVLKPSELAPGTSATVAAMLRGCFPEEFIAVCEGGREVAEALLHERFDKIFYTGSTQVGRAVMAAAARHLTPVTLELGGKCPCIVCADAPLEVTARRIVWGKFMNAGQTCVAPDYLIVDRRIRDALLQAMRDALHKFYGDDPRESPDYGRIVNQRHFDRLAALLPAGEIVHGGRQDAGDRYLEPTILTNVPDDSPLMREEIFGPLLPVTTFDDLDEALAGLRERPDPLALYLFTQDKDIQRRVLQGSRSGGVCVNDTIVHIACASLPFGGLGQSGMGSYHGKASFDCFSHQRSVLSRSFQFDSSLRYPPPGISLPVLKRISRFLLGR